MEKIKCKRMFGKTICTFKNDIITLPIKNKGDIPLTIYTAKECSVCKKITPEIKKMNKNMGNLFSIEIKNVENSITPNSVISLPTIIVGNIPIRDSEITQRLLLEAARKSSLL
jgi:hypothetical protein